LPKRDGATEGVATAAEPAKRKALLPIPEGGGGTISEEKFWAYQLLLTPEDWSHAFGYLYRDWPIIDCFLPYPDRETAKRAGAVKYIERFSEPFDRDTILHRHGSGKYHIDFNDTNKNHESTVCRVFLTLNDDRFPPQVDPATLMIGHADNKPYVAQLRREGKLPPEGGQMAPQSSDTATAQALVGLLRDAMRDKKPDSSLESQVVPQLITMMKTASDQAIQMALGQVRQESPDGVLKLIVAMKELMPQGSSNDKMFELMLKMQADNQRLAAEVQAKNTELLMKLIEAKSAPVPKDESQSFMRPLVEKLIERSLDTLDGGGGGGKFDWREMIPLAIDRLAPTLTNFSAGFRMMMSRGTPGAAATPQPNPAERPAEIPDALPAQGDPMLGLLAEISKPLIEHLRNPELNGEDFAVWFVDGVEGLGGGYGIRLRNEIASMGKEKLLGMAKMFPPLWAQIEPAGEERINSFMDEFLSWQPGADEDEPPEPNAAGPQPVAPRRRAKKGDATA